MNDALYVDLWSNPDVSCAMAEDARSRGLKERSLAKQKADVRAFVRSDLLINATGVIASDFVAGFFSEQVKGPHRSLRPESLLWCQRELRDMDVGELFLVATGRVCGGLDCRPGRVCGAGLCQPAPRRLVASQWLRPCFPIQAKLIAQSQPLLHTNLHDLVCCDDDDAAGGGKPVWQDFFKHLEEDAQVEGVLEERRVCCRDVLVRRQLRSDGLPQPFRPLVLPVFDACGQREFVPEDVRRRRHASLAGISVHGSDIVSLPSDFLCFDCASMFRQAPDREVEANVSSWREKLQMGPSRGLSHVLAERNALRIRDELLALARDDDPTEGGKSRKAFWSKLPKHQAELGYDRCDGVLEKGAKQSLDSLEYWEEPMPEYCTLTRSVFGFLPRGHQMHCSAVQRHEAGAARWSDYSGRPGLVEEAVWQWRLWACARGGFEALRAVERSDMELAEGQADPDFIRVERSHDLFEYGRDMRPPGAVPSLQTWRGLLLRVADDASCVALIRRKADAESLSWGISWNRGAYEVEVGIALSQAHHGGLLQFSELQVFRNCEAHAARHGGAYPREFLLEAGENDRYDHVRQREAALARDAQKIAVRVASMKVESWRRRTELDWLALAEHDDSSFSGAQLPAAHVLDGEEVCVGACDGFGVAPSQAVALDVPDDDAIEAVHGSLDIGCAVEDLNEQRSDLEAIGKKCKLQIRRALSMRRRFEGQAKLQQIKGMSLCRTVSWGRHRKVEKRGLFERL